MKLIWTPWRYKYIKGIAEKGCTLCKIHKDKDSRKRHVLKKDKNAYIVLNKYPYSNGHLMIIPYKHTDELKDLKMETKIEMFELLEKAIDVLKKHLKPEGFNIGVNIGKPAGAGIINHFHIHVVPRWNGDTNFMPIFGQTKIIPQSLDDVYKMFIKDFK